MINLKTFLASKMFSSTKKMIPVSFLLSPLIISISLKRYAIKWLSSLES